MNNSIVNNDTMENAMSDNEDTTWFEEFVAPFSLGILLENDAGSDGFRPISPNLIEKIFCEWDLLNVDLDQIFCDWDLLNVNWDQFFAD
jgi:hypothetical protein